MLTERDASISTAPAAECGSIVSSPGSVDHPCNNTYAIRIGLSSEGVETLVE